MCLPLGTVGGVVVGVGVDLASDLGLVSRWTRRSTTVGQVFNSPSYPKTFIFRVGERFSGMWESGWVSNVLFHFFRCVYCDNTKRYPANHIQPIKIKTYLKYLYAVIQKNN